MKRFFKIFTGILALILLCTTSLGLVACKEEITQVKLTIEVYNFEESELQTKTVVIDLYEDYAPKTVKNIIKYVKDGYYNNTVFYKLEGESNQIMIGDIKINEQGDLVKNALMPTVEGEFESGMVKGSPLKLKTGSIALWRTWLQGDSYSDSSGVHTGTSTWFLPTSDMTSRQAYFCVFATISKNADVLTIIKDSLNNTDEALEYQLYYTGEYDYDAPSSDYGLTAHIVKAEEYIKDDSVFTPEANPDDDKDAHFACYQSKKITVAGVGAGAGETIYGARIVSAKVI